MIATRPSRFGLLAVALAASVAQAGLAHAQTTAPAETKARTAKAKEQVKEKAKAKAKDAGLIDLNSASSAELQTLPGVGEVTARKIIDGRPHKGVEDLAGAGVSASEIAKLRPLVEAKALPAPVDVNAEAAETLETLPGIGPALAREIIAARPLADYEAIGKLKGIGPEKLDALKGRLKFVEPAAAAKAAAKAKAKVAEAKAEEAKAEEKVASTTGAARAKAKMEEAKAKAKVAEAKVEEKVAPKVAEAKAKAKEAAPKLAPGEKVNINTASKEVLDELPGIGPVKAQAILDFRATKKFEKIEDIMEVRGIKEGEFGKIKDIIVVK